MSEKPQNDFGRPLPALDVAAERDILSRALLGATAALARGGDSILHLVCDQLVASSAHIRLVWMTLGGLEEDVLRADYAAGPARAYGERLELARTRSCPIRLAIRNWRPSSADLHHSPACSGHAGQAPAFGLQSVACLPIGRRECREHGVVSIYADRPGYFAAVGLELFAAFADVVGASLEQAKLLRSLSHLANYDQLTGILNRRGLQDQLERELSRSKRRGKPFAVVLFDIDRFKLINDRLGHRQGDLVLKTIAKAAQFHLRKEDCFGRWGGEEFLCLLPETTKEQAGAIAERIRAHIAATAIDAQGKPLHATASFGFACYPEDGADLDKLVAAADVALYQAKFAGRNRSLGARGARPHIYSIGSMLDSALQEGRVVPAYQPIVDLDSGKVVAEEALARLVTASGEVLEAHQFIDAARQLQFLHRVDYEVAMRALDHCALGMTGNVHLDHFVNVSADLLRHHDLVQCLLEAARRRCTSDLSGPIAAVKPMVIEITERELLADIDAARELLTPLIDFGLRLALDDFGSGHSSYQYLADLPVSFLKLDGKLVQRVREPKVRAIIRGIQDTAEQLDIITLAEFVEDAATESVLKELGVRWGQGHFYGKPATANDLAAPSRLTEG